MKYRKKPIEVEAVQIVCASRFSIGISGSDSGFPRWLRADNIEPKDGFVEVITLEGIMRAYPDDWIVKGIEGEIYPVKHSVFVATYEEVEE